MSITETSRYAAGVLLLLGGLIIGGAFSRVRARGVFLRRFRCWGALLLGAGLFSLPATRHYWWAAVILDYGTISLLLAMPRIVNELWSTSRFNLLEEFGAQAPHRNFTLRLFRRGIFTIRMKVERPLRATVWTKYGVVKVIWRDVAGNSCWFSSGSGDAKREAVPAIEHIEQMCMTMH